MHSGGAGRSSGVTPLERVEIPHPPARKCLVGVSGGRDSVALLHLLHARGFRRVVACYLNHGLRGTAGTGDRRFVQRLAARLGFSFAAERVDVRALAAARRLSVETAAREARREFFLRVARRERCRVLLLAHHAEDQAETFLLRLLRGTGPAGLAAMRPVAVRDGLTVLRPLLGTRRGELEDLLLARRASWREDPTNATPAFARNRVRHALLPALVAAAGRDPVEPLCRAAEILADEEEWIAGMLAVETASPPEMLLAADLRAMPRARQRRLLLAWLRARGVAGAGFAETELLRALLDPARGPARVNLPGDRHARRRGGRLFLEPPA